jgi:hypothetical protein
MAGLVLLTLFLILIVAAGDGCESGRCSQEGALNVWFLTVIFAPSACFAVHAILCDRTEPEVGRRQGARAENVPLLEQKHILPLAGRAG